MFQGVNKLRDRGAFIANREYCIHVGTPLILPIFRNRPCNWKRYSLLQIIVFQVHVMPGRVLEPAHFFRGQFAHALRRAAHPQITAFEFLAFGDQAAGAEEGAGAQDRAVENGGTHADEATQLDGAAGNDALMADGDIVADHHRPAARHALVLMRAVEDAAVLDVGARADADDIHVAAHRAHGPDGRVLADDDIADDGCRRVDVNPGPDRGRVALVGTDGLDREYRK